MMWLKACTHCRGDLIEGMDLDGPVVQCLQCGRSAANPTHSRARARSSVVSRRRPRSAVDGLLAAEPTSLEVGPIINAQESGSDAWAS